MGEWIEIGLGEALELVRNGTSKTQLSVVTDYPVTRIETIADWKISYQKVGYVKKVDESYKLKVGDILFSNINSVKHIGKIAMYKGEKPLYHGMNLLLLRFKADLSKDFINYLLIFNKKWFENRASQAVNQASINQTSIKELPLRIPKSKKEQATIAKVLSTVDQAIDQTEKLIAKYERIKTGLMQDLLTKGIDEQGNIRSEETHEFKDSPLGRIPVEWDDLKMKNVSQINQGLQIAIKNRKRYEGQNRHVYITIQYLNNPVKNLEYIENPPNSVIVKRDDVIFTRTGNTGQIVTNVEGVFHNNFFKVDYDRNKVNKEYLVYYLNWEPIQTLIKDLAGTTTIPDLKHGDFYNIAITLPSISEQLKVVSVLNANLKLIRKEKRKKQNLTNLKTGLMQDLLTNKVSVEPLMQKEAAII